jgi:ribose/xylose/arabinose/galactoside ABC-type transport system permease subunit
LRQINLGFVKLPLSKEYSKIIIGIAIIVAVAVDRFSEYLRSKRVQRSTFTVHGSAVEDQKRGES